MQQLIDEGVTIDAVITDPPYGTTACKWDSVIPFPEMWQCINGLIKKNGAVVLFGSEPFSSALRMSNIKNYKYDWYWKKNKSTGFLNVKKQPLRVIEIVSLFYKKQCTYNPQKTKGHRPVNSYTKNTSDGSTLGKTKLGFSGGGSTERYPTNFMEIPVVNNDGSMGKRLHPTQKPVPLMEYLIQTYTNEGDTVLDFTMGSGSTGIACLNTGRSFIGIERDDKYFQVAKDRIEGHK
jgi:site-specific DNA-methyltransferase (adenine-specific)